MDAVGLVGGPGQDSVLEMAGTFRDGALRFQGTHKLISGGSKAHKTTLTPMDGGRLRQFIEESDDGGETWTVAFDGIYVPKGEPAPDNWTEDE